MVTVEHLLPVTSYYQAPLTIQYLHKQDFIHAKLVAQGRQIFNDYLIAVYQMLQYLSKISN